MLENLFTVEEKVAILEKYGYKVESGNIITQNGDQTFYNVSKDDKLYDFNLAFGVIIGEKLKALLSD